VAQKKTASKANKTESKTVTRIKASDDAPEVKSTKEKKSVSAPAVTTSSRKKPSAKSALKPVTAAGGYFKGAWAELKQVRWPTRRATWGLTFAVIAYSAFFVVVVLLLDALFRYLFELILGK
jgi:preprotein translocase SecE subunit